MNADEAIALAIVGVFLLEATNYLLGSDKRAVVQAWSFLAQRTKWLLAPIAVMLVLLGVLLVLTTSPAGARFIYHLF